MMISNNYRHTFLFGMCNLLRSSNTIVTGNYGINTCFKGFVHKFDAKSISIFDPVRKNTIHISLKKPESRCKNEGRTYPIYIIVSNNSNLGASIDPIKHNLCAFLHVGHFPGIMKHLKSALKICSDRLVIAVNCLCFSTSNKPVSN